MGTYIIIFACYIFFCSGLFFQAKRSNFSYKAENRRARSRKSFSKKFLAKINLAAGRTGCSVESMYGPESRKRYREILDTLANGKDLGITLGSFIGYKIILLALFMIAGCFAGSSFPVSIILGLVFGLTGYFVPDLLIKRYRGKRFKEINDDIPYIVDLLYIATLSGQNIYNAIKIVVEKYDGIVCRELSKFLRDVDLGKGKLQAYKNVLDRNNTEDFKNLVFLLMQAERYGSPISEVLKQKSNYIKFEISQNLERKSRKIATAMLFPLVFLILPSFVILVCGPLISLVGGNFLFS